MRPAAWLWLLVALAGGGCGGGGSPPDAAPSDSSPPATDAASLDGGLFADRPYGLYVPFIYDPATPAPLVILLHGYSATATLQNAYWRLSPLADTEGFLLALPEGTVDPDGNQFWNATDGCCDFYGSGVDDVAYLNALIDDVEAKYNVDPRRVFAAGHSNGGFMAHRLACDLAPRIAAIVSLAGTTWLDPAQCTPAVEVAVLQVHGDLDDTVPYGGSPVLPSALASASFWAAFDGCTSGPTLVGRLDLVTNLAADETRLERWDGCVAGGAELWTIEMGGHVPLFGDAWAPAIWGFLAAHARP